MTAHEEEISGSNACGWVYRPFDWFH